MGIEKNEMNKPEKMRICLLTTSFPLKEGMIAGPFVVEQTQQLTRSGVKVHVMAPHHYGVPRKEIMDGVHVKRIRYMFPAKKQTLCYGAGIPTNLRRSWWAKLQVPFLLLSFFFNTLKTGKHCDVIQANWSLAGLAGIIAGKLLRKPVVLIMYGAEVFVLKDNPLFKWPLKSIIKHADHVIAISQFTLDKVLELQKPKAISLIPPGVDIERFYSRRKEDGRTAVDEKLAQQGIDRNKPLVFALGSFIERKGFKYLISAIAEAQKSLPVQLMLGGRGPLKEELQQHARDLGIEDRVFFLGFIPDQDLPEYYSAADLLAGSAIVDSKGDTEGLGMTPAEAMSCSTPSIATRTGGVVDIVKDGLNGFLVEPKDYKTMAERIVRLCKDNDLRLKLGSQGRQFIEEHFSWPDKAAEVLEIHQQVVERRRKTK